MTPRRLAQTTARGCVATVALLLAGCFGIFETQDRGRRDLGVEPIQLDVAGNASFRDTIGSLAYYDGLRSLRVRGYGLVVALGTNGSSDCPKRVFNELVERVRKSYDFVGTRIGDRTLPPERVIRDVDTAVVMVQGDIPPGALPGTTFDVRVTALPGTKTKSLRGGRLFTTDLEIFRITRHRGSISGRVFARASGPVFLNPFSSDTAATRTSRLEATIPGGGVVKRGREVRLVLYDPSHVRAKRIQDRINDQFAGAYAVADAVSPSYVKLSVPPAYRDDQGHFFALVRGLYLSRRASFAATRARELQREMLRPNARYGPIALCLEGLGRDALPVLDELYAHQNDAVSFHAAVAGIRLGSHIAADAMAIHAADVDCTFRYQAIRALSKASGMANAAGALRRLLDDVDPRVRVAAYEALVERGDPTINTTHLGTGSFTFDVVPSTRPTIVYARRYGTRRLAVLGRDPVCMPPVFYRAPDRSVTLTASAGDDALTAIRVTPRGTVSPAIPAPRRLTDLIKFMGRAAGKQHEEVTGLGLDYTAVVGAVSGLCGDHSVDASFVLEQPNAAEAFGPPRPEERPESDL